MINSRLSRFIVAICFTAVLVAPSASRSASADDVDTERAMRSLQRTTWYDGSQDSYKPPTIVPEKDDGIRRSGWLAPPKKEPKPWNWQWGNWNMGNWGYSFGQFFTRAVLIVLLIALLVIVGGLIFYAFRDYLPNYRRNQGTKKAIEIDPARVEDLPFEVEVAHGDPLSEAKRLMQGGEYNRAIIYLYGYMLLALDNAHFIHLLKGKTNRMYLRELQRRRQRLRSIVENTMLGFEYVYFGKHSLSSEQFATLWGQLDEFHNLLTNEVSTTSTAGVDIVPSEPVEVAKL